MAKDFPKLTYILLNLKTFFLTAKNPSYIVPRSPICFKSEKSIANNPDPLFMKGYFQLKHIFGKLILCPFANIWKRISVGLKLLK